MTPMQSTHAIINQVLELWQSREAIAFHKTASKKAVMQLGVKNNVGRNCAWKCESLDGGKNNGGRHTAADNNNGSQLIFASRSWTKGLLVLSKYLPRLFNEN
jgi:hypothetical protein